MTDVIPFFTGKSAFLAIFCYDLLKYMATLFYIILANLLISAISLIGVSVLAIKKKNLEAGVLFLVALSAGALMAGAFLDLLPEGAEKLSADIFYLLVLASFALFFLIEKIFHFRHCHKGKCEVHIFGYLNLLGDAVHNFIDGLLIAGAFLADIRLGLVASLAVVFHEIPQEIGDFGVLIYSGFSKKKALAANFLSGLFALLGGLAGYVLSMKIENISAYLIPMAAGSFIYIATSDLIPEIKKEKELKKSIYLFFWFIFGIFLIYSAGKIF
jgi:zinc and cadmium transporter